MAKANTGAVGPYHLHTLFSILVGAELIPSRYVTWWPVARDARTMEGLALVFSDRPRALQGFTAVSELWRRLAKLGELRQREHVGCLGAQLCFWKRSRSEASGSSFATRLEETVDAWDTDLADLRNACLLLLGWHKDA